MIKNFLQSITCSAFAFFIVSNIYAEEYNYIGTQSWYSMDDPSSWSPKGGPGGSYEWLKGQTLIFDSNTNIGSAGKIEVKYLKDGDTPDIGEIIFKTTTTVQASTSSNTTLYIN